MRSGKERAVVSRPVCDYLISGFSRPYNHPKTQTPYIRPQP
jgi:hypothetical protein